MKKITLFMLLLLSSHSLIAQVLNQSANWPNANWTLTGTFEATALTADPTNADSNFSYNDDAAGFGSTDVIELASPIIDLTAASTAGETWLTLDYDYDYNLGDVFNLEYFDADTAAWVVWEAIPDNSGSISNWCGAIAAPSVLTQILDISGFSANQLSNFQYRFFYDATSIFGWGFCVSSPTILSETPPACIDPSNLSATVNMTDVDLAWDLGSTESAWEVVNQLEGTGAPSGSGTAVTDNPYQIMGLTEGTDYEFYVRANCGADGFSNWVGPFLYSIAAPGAVCENPIIVVNPLPYVTTDDTANYGDDYGGAPGADCGTFSGYLGGDDVVYSYTATSDTSINIELSNSSNWTGVFVYNDCADIENQCATGAVNGFAGGNILLNEFAVTNAETYYIIISTWPAPQSTAYTLTISENTCTNLDATFTVVEDCANGEQFIINVDVTDLGSATLINISDDQGNTDTASATGIVTLGPYPNGTNVTVTAENDADSNCSVTSDVLTQAACPPDNDLCVNATLISCGDSISGNNSAATSVDASTDFCGTGSNTSPGVWYTFEGNDNIVNASLCTSLFDTKLQVFEGSCGALNCVIGTDDGGCDGGQPFTSEVDFIANTGTTYYIYVFGFNDNEFGDYTLNIECVELPDPPANDECADATVVIANTGGECIEFGSGTIFGATASNEANGCGGTADDDVWFEFVATSENHGVSLQNIVGDTQDLYHVLYEGTDCNSLTELYCSDPNQSVANGLTIGNTYKVRVYSWTGNPLQDVTFDICIFSIPPPIYVSSTDFTVEELINDVLVDSECNQVFNITSSTGTDFGGDNGIGYFEANGSEFPFERGLILTTGRAEDAPGPEDGTLSGGNWPGDADLESVIPSLNPGDTNDATLIQFDFIPVINTMSFDFIFAAEEYGTFQCTFADSFAFLLTDTNGVTTNLAIVPGTVDPISVFTVRDETHNGGCASVNPEFFGNYYGATGQPALTSPTNFIGNTVIMTASADVVPNELYTIKLVIADAIDNLFDSAVFLGAGSFDIGDIDLGDDILLASGNANCAGDVVTLDAGEIPNNSTLIWYQDGVEIEGSTNQQTIEVGTTAFYRAEITVNNTDCVFMDEVLIEFFPNPDVSLPDDVIKCANESLILEATVANENDPNMSTLTYEWTLLPEGATDTIALQTGPQSTYELTIEDEYTGTVSVIVTDDVTGCLGEDTMLVEFYQNSNCVDVPQGLSPNGDSFNDCLILDHLEDREDIKSINVYNRYGTKVFELNEYVDQWCGTDDDGELLPVGTYFYTINFNSDKKSTTSWIYLNY